MNISELTTMLVKIKAAGNQIGLTDDEIGKLEIQEMKSGDKTKFFPVDFTIELGKIRNRGTGSEEKFIYLQHRTPRNTSIITPFKFKA